MIAYPHCKINLGLHVVARRADGYHNIETVFVPVFSMRDALEVTMLDASATTAVVVQEGIELDNLPIDNLCMRAWQRMHDMYGVPPVHIRLHKNVPFGAGLGGGSSDAAYTIRMLNAMFGLGLDAYAMQRVASTIGADCAFFVTDTPMYATGIGDITEPVAVDLSNYSIRIELPAGEHVSTREAYAGIKPRGEGGGVDLRQAIKQPIEQWRNTVVNDFEASVFDAHPAIAALKAKMYADGAVYASMTGSGAAVYGIFRKED